MGVFGPVVVRPDREWIGTPNCLIGNLNFGNFADIPFLFEETMAFSPLKRSGRIFFAFGINAASVYGMMFLMLGATLGYIGASRLYDLFLTVRSLLPLGPSEQTIEKISSAWPVVFSYFVTFVSSVSAVLFGVVWFFSGLADFFRTGSLNTPTGTLQRPEDICNRFFMAERLSDSGNSSGHQFGSFPGSGFSYSPVSKSLLKIAIISFLKIAVVWFVFWVLTVGIEVAPHFLNRFFSLQVSFIAPSFNNIHLLFFAGLCFNLLVGASLLSKKGPVAAKQSELVSIEGNFAAPLYLSIFESAFSLLSPKGVASAIPFRLRCPGIDGVPASLVESFPKPLSSVSNPLGFLFVPLAFFLTIWGFTSLLAFSSTTQGHTVSNFLSAHFPLIVVDIFFYVAMIWFGLHVADWIRVLFSVKRYESILALCAVESSEKTEFAAEVQAKACKHDEPLASTLEQGPTNELLVWSKTPSKNSRFRASLVWAKVITESLGDSSGRFYCKDVKDAEVDVLVRKIFALTQDIHVQRIDPLRDEDELHRIADEAD